jgi:hypothetical protein
LDWGYIYGRTATGLAISYREVGEFTFPEILDLFEYWEKNPPPHELQALIATALGWKSEGRSVSSSSRATPDNTIKVVDQRTKELAFMQMQILTGGKGGQFHRGKKAA